MTKTTMYSDVITLDGKDYKLINVNYKPEESEETNQLEAIHHIHVIDRSYSMSHDINNLINNVIETFNHIGDKDLISVIWFSSENLCKVLFKGATISNKDMIIKKLDSIRSCNGLTCFSEPLKQVREVVEDLGDLCPNFNICFFTDGETVTNWSTTEEHELIFNEIDKINSHLPILALNSIGYGNFYDEKLLTNMADKSVFGRFTHSSNIHDYSTIFTHVYKTIKDNVSESCSMESNESQILYVTPKDAKLYTDTFHTTFLNKIKNQFFIITNQDKFKINDEEYEVKDITKTIPKPTKMNFLYAYAKELYYNGKQHEAIDILALHIHDKYLVDLALNAFTRDERANVTKEITEAFIHNKKRLVEGELEYPYLPDKNAYSAVNLLAELSKINGRYIPVSDYTRIGREVTYGANLFTSDNNRIAAPMADLVFNEKKLNISIRYMITGSVNLNHEQAQTVGLEKSYDSKMYRMQTIIKDGTLNIPKIDVLLTDGQHEMLSDSAKSCIESFTTTTDGLLHCKFDLTRIPVINRGFADKDLSSILDASKLILKNKATMKVLRELISKQEPAPVMGFMKSSTPSFTEEQIQVLKEHGLNTRLEYVGIEAKAVLSETGDFYEARSIEFAIKGCSSVPKVSDSIKKQENGKKLNYLDQCILDALNQYSSLDRSFLELKLESLKNETIDLNSLLFAVKLAKVLTGGWWTGLTVTPKSEDFEKDGFTLQIKTKREKVYL